MQMCLYILIWSFVINGQIFEGEATFSSPDQCEMAKNELLKYEVIRNSPNRKVYCKKCH